VVRYVGTSPIYRTSTFLPPYAPLLQHAKPAERLDAVGRSIGYSGPEAGLTEKHGIYTNILREGYHVPAVRRRDMFYAKLEDQRAEALGQV